MNIKKIGHCCLLIDTGKVRILTDPGAFTASFHKDLVNIDIILVTHEHSDHLHVDSLEEIISNNIDVQIFTNSAVGKLLSEKNIKYIVLEGSDVKEVLETVIEAFDARHEEIFEEVGQVQNTGYFINNKLFYPGDAYCDPGKKVDVLALPVAGPWCKMADVIQYALKLKPNKVFPVHDGVLNSDGIAIHHRISGKILAENGINFIPMLIGDKKDF